MLSSGININNNSENTLPTYSIDIDNSINKNTNSHKENVFIKNNSQNNINTQNPINNNINTSIPNNNINTQNPNNNINNIQNPINNNINTSIPNNNINTQNPNNNINNIQNPINNINTQNSINNIQNPINNIKTQNSIDNNNIINKQNLNQDDIFFEYNELTHIFSFYDISNKLIGSFNLAQILKYIGSNINENFYINTNSSEEIIKKMLFELFIDPITKNINIQLKSYNESPILGNIELLIKINNIFLEYSTKNINNDILLFNSDKEKTLYNSCINQLICILINHTLHIISLIINDIIDINLKNKLINYSNKLISKLGFYINKTHTNYNTEFKLLDSKLNKLLSLKENISNKIINLEQKINKQNDLIFSIIQKNNSYVKNNWNNKYKNYNKFNKYNKFNNNNENDENNYISEVFTNEKNNYMLTDSE